MGRWLAALKKHENAESGHPRNLQNLSGEGFDGSEGTPFDANADFSDSKPALPDKVSRVLRVPISPESENSYPAVEAAARAAVPDAEQYVEAHPVETKRVESVAAPEPETAICDAELYARALRLHGPLSYGMAMRCSAGAGREPAVPRQSCERPGASHSTISAAPCWSMRADAVDKARLGWPAQNCPGLSPRGPKARDYKRRRRVMTDEWTAKAVADHFEEAFRTLRKLPPVTVQGYFNSWPDIARSRREIAFMEAEPMRFCPSAAAITRLEQTLDWIAGSRWRSASSSGRVPRACRGSRSAANSVVTAPRPGGAGSSR